MTSSPPSYESRSTDQLVVLDDWIQHQIQSLAGERKLILEELRRREVVPVPLALPAAGEGHVPGATLNYLTPADAALARPGAIGDPYADHARNFGLRMALVLGGAMVAATLLAFLAAAL